MNQAGPLFGEVDAGLHYDTNLDRPDNYQTTYDGKTKIVIFYSLSNAIDLTSGSTFRENIDPHILK